VPDLLEKIKTAGLVGRGGAEFPTVAKWQSVGASSDIDKYLICNASEGEIGLFKDIFILENYPEQVIDGMAQAMGYLKIKVAYFNINKKYYQRVGRLLKKICYKYRKNGFEFRFFIEEPSYIGGEETAILNSIQGLRVEPRLKPPFPTEHGLFNQPTLIHNVETLFNISLVNDDLFENRRFYCLSGEIPNPGVFNFPADWSIKKVLKESKNWPDFEFFVQIGGSASGPVLNSGQLKQRVSGAGSIEVYPKNISQKILFLRWLKFFKEESCGQCVPCREGSFQLYRLVKNCQKIDKDQILAICEVVRESSFCALGKSISIPIESYYKNIIQIR